MNWRAVRAIAGKDLRMVVQAKAVMLPIVLLPVIILVVLPIVYSVLIQYASSLGPSANLGSLKAFFDNMPAGLRAEVAGFNDSQLMVVLVLTYFLAPMYLIIPMMVSAVIAADSLAGERERKTIEALVYTPTTDFELYSAKMLAAWIPALAVGLVGFVLYTVTVNLAAGPIMGRIFFPNPMWILLAFWVGPAAAAVGLGAMVLVSSRVASFQEANQLGGLVVLPIVLLVVAQATGVMYLSVELVALLGLALWVIAAWLLYLGQRLFRRGQILARA